MTLDIPNLPAGDYVVAVNLLPEHNRYYCTCESGRGFLTVYEPERASAVGAGKIKDANGHSGHFIFNVKYNCKGVLKGFIMYMYAEGDWVYILKSSEILSLSTDGKHAFFEATFTISGCNFKTHEKFKSDDSYRARIDAFDNKDSREKDAFQIRLLDNIGLVEYEAGFDPYGSLLCGNIVVNPGRHRHRH